MTEVQTPDRRTATPRHAGADVVSLDPHRHVPGVRRPGFGAAVSAEWIKL